MPFTLAYMIIRSVLSLVAMLVRGDVSKHVEYPVLRHENAVLRRERDDPLAHGLFLDTLAGLDSTGKPDAAGGNLRPPGGSAPDQPGTPGAARSGNR
jgi:hypothetical protein